MTRRLCCTLFPLLIALTLPIAAAPAAAITPAPFPSRHPSGPAGIRVSGRTLSRDGASYVPKGATLIAFAAPASARHGFYQTAYMHFGATELDAAAAAGVDTLRFQVSQPGLDPQSPLYSASFTMEVVNAVTLARSKGFAVIVSMQDEAPQSGETVAHPLPVMGTLRAWQVFAPYFATDPNVMYELFNEPQPTPTAANWQRWHDGDPAPPTETTAVGMQTILNAIRALGAGNVVLADGLNYAQSFKGAPFLNDSMGQVVYAFHPYFDTNDETLAEWQTNWGALAGSAPTIASEWGAWSEVIGPIPCNPQSPQLAVQLLAYLQQLGVGVVGYAYDNPGTIVQNATMTWTWQPTIFDANFTCGVAGEGSGALLEAQFALPLPALPTPAPVPTPHPTVPPPMSGGAATPLPQPRLH